jgi:hypothetical protein
MIFSSAICFLQLSELTGVNYAPTKGKLLRIYQKTRVYKYRFFGWKRVIAPCGAKGGR